MFEKQAPISVFLFCLIFSSCCTFSLTNVMTSGKAEDIVDGQQTQDPDPSFNVELPKAI